MHPPITAYYYKKWFLRLFFWLIDTVGYALFQKPTEHRFPRPPQSILVIRRDALGDMLYTLPALRALKKAYTQATVTVFAHPRHRELLSREEGLRVIFSIRELRKQKYDIAIDFKGHLNSILLMLYADSKYKLGYGDVGLGFLLNYEAERKFDEHVSVQNLKLVEHLGVKTDRHMTIPIRDEDRKRIANIIQPNTITVHMGAGAQYKIWPERNFQKLIAWLQETYDANVFIIPPSPFTVFELAAILEKCILFIGNSSFPGHLAATVGIPTITLFHDGDAVPVWKPIGDRAQIILPDNPISGIGLGPTTRDRMERISVEKVKFVTARTLSGLGMKLSKFNIQY